MWSNRQKLHDADAERARQNLPEPTGLWRVPGAHVAAMGASFGDRVGGAVSIHSLEDKKGAVVYASRLGWNYGGAVNPHGSQLSSSSHNASHAVALNFFFGRAPLVNTAAPYANLRGSSRVTTVATVEALDAMTRPLSPGTRLWLTQTHPRFPWQPPSTAMLAALRAGAACSLARYRRHLRFAPGRRTVAVHLRRGDVSPSTSGNRCTPRPGPATWCVTIGHSRVPTHHAHAPGRQG